MLAQAIQVGIQLASTVVLARLLGPEEYGVIAMVMAVAAFAQVFGDLGLSTAAIQKKGLTDAQQTNLFWLNVLVGLVLTCVVAASAPLVVKFYAREELLWVTVAVSINFLIASLGAQHSARLVRDMQFAKKSIATIAGALLTLLLSIYLAYAGCSYWSLVWGRLAGALVAMLLLWCFSPFLPSLPNRGSEMRELVGFGANVTASSFVNYFSRNLDNILIGKYVGAEALGFYGRAYQLLMFPINSLRAPIQAVAFPAMSRLDPNSEEYRRYYSQLVRVVSWLTMPLMAFVCMSADDIVDVVLGDTWADVAPILAILALVGIVQPVSSLRGIIMLSSGQTKRQLKATVMTAILVLSSFCFGINWGVTGIAWSYAIAVWGVALPMQYYSSQNTSIRLSDVLSVIKVPLFCVGLSIFIMCFHSRSQWLSTYSIISVNFVIVFVISGLAFFLEKEARCMFLEGYNFLRR